MTIVLAPIVIAVIGLLIYAFAKEAKLQEVGRIMFFCGLLVALWVGAPVLVR